MFHVIDVCIEAEHYAVRMQPDDANSPAQANAAVAHKEKSVLQAKLTKLAIQIGYAGKTHRSSSYLQLL